jgi:hypothetical protein
MRGTMTGPLDPPGLAGRAIEVEGVDLWTMRDGRIARHRAFYDNNESRSNSASRRRRGERRRWSCASAARRPSCAGARDERP